jgi:ABC-type nitrate/sulfonate/bicarbonate transport system substrate-binding protein
MSTKHPQAPQFICQMAVLVLIVAGLAACGKPAAPALTPITVQLSWTHQAQFAGMYAADLNGYYKAEGLAVTFVEGGPTLDPIEVVLAGKAQFGVSAADTLLIERSAGKPVSATRASMSPWPARASPARRTLWARSSR